MTLGSFEYFDVPPEKYWLKEENAMEKLGICSAA